MTRQMADDEVLQPEVVAYMRRAVCYRAVDGRAEGERITSERMVSPDDIALITLTSHQFAVTALRAELDGLRTKTAVTLGVGSGGGSLFVHGDHDSIKAAQDFIFRAERAESALEALRGQVAGLVADAYAAGWVVCSQWARREDLVHDIGSGAYAEERDAALLAIKERMG